MIFYWIFKIVCVKMFVCLCSVGNLVLCLFVCVCISNSKQTHVNPSNCLQMKHTHRHIGNRLVCRCVHDNLFIWDFFLQTLYKHTLSRTKTGTACDNTIIGNNWSMATERPSNKHSINYPCQHTPCKRIRIQLFMNFRNETGWLIK